MTYNKIKQTVNYGVLVNKFILISRLVEKVDFRGTKSQETV